MSRSPQRAVAVMIDAVRVRAPLQQHLRRRRAAAQGRHVQGGEAVVVRLARVRPAVQFPQDRRQIAVSYGEP